MTRRGSFLLAAALAAELAGCAGAPTRIHTLEPSPGEAAGRWARPAFRVDAVHIPPAFDRPELVRREGPYTVALSDRDRWAAPLGELVRRALTQDLASRLPAGAVIFPDAPKPPVAAGLVVDILTLSSGPDGVRMQASWTWLAPRADAALPAAVVAPRSVTLTTPSRGEAPEALAPELSELLAKLADAIAAGSA